MSGSWFARPLGWDLSRVSHSARVAGAHLAVTRIDGGDVSTGLVLGVVPWRPVEFVMAASSHHCAGWFDIVISGALESQVHWSVGSEAFLGPAIDGYGIDSEKGSEYVTEISSR